MRLFVNILESGFQSYSKAFCDVFQVFIVTGGLRGIGRSVIERLLNLGASVIISKTNMRRKVCSVVKEPETESNPISSIRANHTPQRQTPRKLPKLKTATLFFSRQEFAKSSIEVARENRDHLIKSSLCAGGIGADVGGCEVL